MECDIVLGGWRVADVEGKKGGCGLQETMSCHGSHETSCGGFACPILFPREAMCFNEADTMDEQTECEARAASAARLSRAARAARAAGGGCRGDEGRLWLAGHDEMPWLA